MQYKYQINPKYSDKEDFLFQIDSYFENSSYTIHKARNELKIINIDSLATVVKSFKIPNIINQIAYAFFKSSKAKKSYEYSIKIGNFTPKAIGYIEFYDNSLLKQSYFISEQFLYDFTIREPLLDENFEDRENIFKAFALFTLKLHNADIFHNDYSPGNILIQKNADGYIFKIVDINRMGFFQLTEKDRAKNFSKLWARDDVLTIIATEYNKLFKMNENFIDDVLYYSNKNKRVKNFKKRVKGKEVND